MKYVPHTPYPTHLIYPTQPISSCNLRQIQGPDHCYKNQSYRRHHVKWCPRVNKAKPSLSDKIDSVNAGLQVLCQEETVTFKDNNPSFHLADGTINDGYLLADGVHLTRTATDKLAKNLGLNIKSGNKTVCKDRYLKPKQQNNQQIQRHDNRRQDSSSDGEDEWSHPFWRNTRKKANNYTSRETAPLSNPRTSRHDTRSSRRDGSTGSTHYSQSAPHTNSSHYTNSYSSQRSSDNDHANQTRCYNCYESNHVVNSCKHDRPIRCNTCGMEGHKAKHHTY